MNLIQLFFLHLEVNECDSLPCLHGGKCVDLNAGNSGSGSGSGNGIGGSGIEGSGSISLYKCICPAGYTGKMCETGKKCSLT